MGDSQINLHVLSRNRRESNFIGHLRNVLVMPIDDFTKDFGLLNEKLVVFAINFSG